MVFLKNWLLNPSHLWFWEWLEFLSIIIVGVGCWGEGWAEHHRFSVRPDTLSSVADRRRFYERLFWSMVVWGLAVELFAFLFAFLGSNREIENLRTQNLLLQQEIQQAKPENQKIVSVTATAWFHLDGTNLFPVPTTANNPFVSLCIGQYAQVKSNGWAVNLIEKSIEVAEAPGFRLLSIEFGKPPDEPTFKPILDNLAHTINSWDAAVLHTVFLRKGVKVLNGRVSVVINGTISKDFVIPPQTPYFELGDPPKLEGATATNALVRVTGSPFRG